MSKSIILSNIFSNDEIKTLYKDINKQLNNNSLLQESLGRIYCVLYWRENNLEKNTPANNINKKLTDKIIKKVEEHTNIELQLESIAFARYSNKYGIPNLHPHVDNNYKIKRITFDVQLDGNIDWPIIVEEKKYLLKNNDAIMFSGTHEVHWREKKFFNDSEYVDILLCQLSNKNDNNIIQNDQSFIKNISIKEKILKIKYEKDIK